MQLEKNLKGAKNIVSPGLWVYIGGHVLSKHFLSSRWFNYLSVIRLMSGFPPVLLSQLPSSIKIESLALKYPSDHTQHPCALPVCPVISDKVDDLYLSTAETK